MMALSCAVFCLLVRAQPCQMSPCAPGARRVARGADVSGLGLALMAGYLLADGYTSTFQQRLFSGYEMSSLNQVLYTGLCSIALSSFGEQHAGWPWFVFVFK
jgi:hypothetical protein